MMNNTDTIYMLTNGSATPDSSILNTTLLHPFSSTPPPPGKADLTKSFAINQTGITTWVIDRYPYAEASIPILSGTASSGWNANTTIHLPFNSTIDIVMHVANESMDSVRICILILNPERPVDAQFC